MNRKIRTHVQEAIIQELGDTTNIYPFKEIFKETTPDSFLVEYEFKTDKGTRYEVSLDYNAAASDFIYVDFKGGGSYKKTVDEGTTFQSIATIIRILANFWQNRHDMVFDQERCRYDTVFEVPEESCPSQETISQLEGFEFTVVGRGSRTATESARFKLYKAFIDRQFPSATILTDSHGIQVIPGVSR